MSRQERKTKRWQEAQEFEYSDWIKIPNIIEKEWNEIVNKYKAYFQELSNKLQINDSWKILDVGCGPTCTSRLFRTGEKYGVDPLAEKLHLDDKIKEVKVINAKGEEIPFENSFFDLVICRNVIDHSESPYQLVKEVRRVLKDDGVFILACYVYPLFIWFIKLFSEIIYVLRNIAHPFTFSIKTLENLVSDDFSITERKIIHIGYNPNDYGKIGEQKSSLSFLYQAILFINFNILRQRWFVKELLYVLKPKWKIKSKKY